MSSSSSSSSDSNLPVKSIPGGYGIPFFGAILDRYDYYYNQGRDKFFASRIQKYRSTVFRTNMAPGPFNASDPRVICLLDAVSFPILFDTSKVEKRNVFTGTYMPSTTFTGGYRVCAYLDPSEPKHTLIKRFFFSILASRHDQVLPLLRSYLSELFIKLEDKISQKGESYFNTISDNEFFNFVFRFYCGKDPAETKLGSTGPTLFELWLYPQVAPLGSLGLPGWLLPINLVEDFFLHTLPFPAWTLKWDHKKLYDAIYTCATKALDEAARIGISREEACNNLLFVLGFNSYGGFKIFIPTIMKWVGLAGEGLHRDVAAEVRSLVKEEGGLTFGALDKMSLTKSVVWEVMRIEPPVQFQYAKAKEDLVIHNHDTAFRVNKGEMLFGYQPFATKDPKIFENPEEFVGHRFVGDQGKKLLKYVYWSNGRETEDPKEEDKQCPGKNLVELVCMVFLVDFFLRYDTFTVEVGKPALGPTVTIKSLIKASN